MKINCKKIRVFLAATLVFTIMFGVASHAAAWYQKNVNVRTKAYTSTSFQSEGAIRTDLKVVNTVAPNTGTLKLQRLNTSTNTWTDVVKQVKSLNVGSNLSTLFSSILVPDSSGTYRIVFEASSIVSLSGSIHYFY